MCRELMSARLQTWPVTAAKVQERGADSMKEFLVFLRRSRTTVLETFNSPLAFCQALAADAALVGIGAEAARHLQRMTPDVRDYAISSAYALLIGPERRKRLSAYFTPPALAKAAIAAAATFVDERANLLVLDPACGGGSFLVPLVEHLVRRERQHARSTQEACASVVSRVRGLEIDEGLATLSEQFLTKMLLREFGYKRAKSSAAVRVADALSVAVEERFDLIVGNPPYGRVGRGADVAMLTRAGLANIGGHTNLYSLFLLRSLDWLKPGGGLVFIVPTSFVAGPYFSGLRQEILDRAQVSRIDHHEQREDLFIDAVQDVCLIVLRRRTLACKQLDKPYQLGWIDAAGTRHELGVAIATPGGEPWTLPVQVGSVPISQQTSGKGCRSFVIADYGYRLRVGKVVPTRERERLRSSRTQTSLPLVWASDVRPDGSFMFEAARRTEVCAWYEPATGEVPSYATRVSAVIVQRTSNRDQRRRLNAAAVDAEFLKTHAERGFVAENHVIVLEVANQSPAASPEKLAALLNSAPVNERFSAVCGSFSVSAKLLARLALPDPAGLPSHVTDGFEAQVREAFEQVPHLLAASEGPRDAQDSLDQPCNLLGSAPVDKDARLERRAIP